MEGCKAELACSCTGVGTTEDKHTCGVNAVSQWAAGKPRQSVWTTHAAVGQQVRHVKSTSEELEAIQVLEDRLRDWMTNNSPAPAACDTTWSKPFSAIGAPPRISELHRPAKAVFFSTV